MQTDSKSNVQIRIPERSELSCEIYEDKTPYMLLLSKAQQTQSSL